MGDDSTWAMIPPDVLVLIISLIPEHGAAALMRTCSQWNRSIKSQLMRLDCLNLGNPWKFSFSAARTASLPLVHTKLDGFTHFLAPLRPDCVGVKEVLPNLTSLDACGQALTKEFIHSFPPSLKSLNAAFCDLKLTDLQHALPSLPELQQLDLSGLRAPDLRQTLPSFLAALTATTSITSLDLSASPSHLRHGSQANRVGLLLRWKHLGTWTALSESSGSFPQLPALRSLRFLGHPLHEGELRSLSQCTGLRSLALSCFARDQEQVALWDETIQGMTQLTSLFLELPSFPMQGDAQISSLAPLTKLESLKLTNCTSVSLVLSCSTLTSLTRLDLTFSTFPVSPELVVQVCSNLPCLSHLDVSHSGWDKHFQLPGDILVRGLARTCNHIETLRMDRIQMHGTGFSLPDTAPTAALPKLKELVIHAGLLLKCKLRDLSTHTQLQKLTMTGVSTEVFNATAKVNGYMELSRLVHLTQLAVLNPPTVADFQNGIQSGWGLAPAVWAPMPEQHEGAAAAGHQPAWDPAQNAMDTSDEDDGDEQLGYFQDQGAAWLLPGGQNGQNPHADEDHNLEEGSYTDEEEEYNEEEEGDGAGGIGGMVNLGAGHPNEPVLNVMPYREPHMHFLLGLSGLQVLVLKCIESSGVCFQHIMGLPKLRVLHLSGRFCFTRTSIKMLRAGGMPNLRSLRLLTCSWMQPSPPNRHAVALRALLGMPSSSSFTPPSPATINDLVGALALCMPCLEHLELGDCPSLEVQSLRTLGDMHSLRHLMLHRSPLSESQCRAALEGVHSSVNFFASSPRSSANSWYHPLGVEIAFHDSGVETPFDSTTKIALGYLLSNPATAQHFPPGGFMLSRHAGKLSSIWEGQAPSYRPARRAR